jgi:hypothetical protein
MKQETTVNLHELNEAPFRLSLVLNIRSTPFHRPSVIGYPGSIPFVPVSVLHRSDILVKTLTMFVTYGTTVNWKGNQASMEEMQLE